MSQDIAIRNADVTLAATLWRPATITTPGPHPGVVMVGGSGPTDRHNDVFFPPIREHLLASGVAVLSYDKRGVGGSTGSWLTSGYDALADDTVAAVRTLRSQPDISSVGLFGHSEGAWIVLKAASRAARDGEDIAYVVTNSGSGTGPAVQDRFATAEACRRQGRSEAEVGLALACHDRISEALRAGDDVADVLPWLTADPGYPLIFAEGELPTEPMWSFMKGVIDYDPAPDADGIACPHLALFGADDPVVSVELGIASFAESANRRRRRGRSSCTVEVFPDAGHRVGFERDGKLADGYLDTLSGWIAAHASGF